MPRRLAFPRTQKLFGESHSPRLRIHSVIMSAVAELSESIVAPVASVALPAEETTDVVEQG